MTGSGGGSSTPRLLDSITAASGNTGSAFALRATADKSPAVGTLPCSRGMLRPSFSNSFAPLRTEGAGNAGCALHPRSRVQKCALWRTRAYRAAETLRHPLRNGFTAYSALSPATNSSCHRHRRIKVLRARSSPHRLRRFSASNGRQDHTASPYAKSVIRRSHAREPLTGFIPPCELKRA
jgi:hypothetical protein